MLLTASIFGTILCKAHRTNVRLLVGQQHRWSLKFIDALRRPNVIGRLSICLNNQSDKNKTRHIICEGVIGMLKSFRASDLTTSEKTTARRLLRLPLVKVVSQQEAGMLCCQHPDKGEFFSTSRRHQMAKDKGGWRVTLATTNLSAGAVEKLRRAWSSSEKCGFSPRMNKNVQHNTEATPFTWFQKGWMGDL